MPLPQNPKVRAVTDLLRSELEEVFLQTSEACAFRLQEVDTEGENDEGTNVTTIQEIVVLRESLQRWRELSLEQIAVHYRVLLGVAMESDEDIVRSADVATELAWSAIDQAFDWVSEGPENSSRFTEWLNRCGAVVEDYMASEVWPHLEKPHSSEAIESRLNEDFHALFERRLTKLRNESLLSREGKKDNLIPLTPSNSARHDDKRPKPYIQPPDLESKDKVCRGKARAWVVECAIKELDYLRPLFEQGQSAEELSTQYPDFLVFQEKRMGKLLINASVAKKAYKEAALEVAAATIGLAKGTVENAWKKYRHDLPKKTRR